MKRKLALTLLSSLSSMSGVLAFFLHVLVSFLVIGVVAYLFGYELITDPLSGNDALNSLTYIVYLNEHFPKIPLWFPYQGGGISATLGYPQLHSYVVILLSRLTGLTFISSMGIINFASLLLPAWGVYLFVATRLKSKAGGLVGGLFCLLSHMAYVWIWGAGFLAQTFSVVFVAPYLIFYDWFLDSYFQKKSNAVALLLAALFGAFAFLSHPATSLGLMAFSAFYAFGRAFLSKEGILVERITRGIGALVLATVFVIGLVAFWYFPLSSYLGYANRDLTPTLDTSIFAPLEAKGSFGLYGRGDGYPFGDFSIYPAVWIMAAVGVVLGFFYNRKATILGLLALFSIYVTGSLSIWKFLAHFSFFIARFFDLRPWYPLSTVLNPIVAGIGVVYGARLGLSPLFWLESRKLAFVPKSVVKSLRFVLHPALAIVVAIGALYFLTPIAGMYDPNKPWIVPFGPNIEGINFHGVWNRSYEERCNLSKEDGKWSPLCELPDSSGNIEANTLVAKCDEYPEDQEKPLICIGEKPIIRILEYDEWDWRTESYYKVVNREKILVPIDEQDVEAFIASCFKEGESPPYFHPDYSPCLALGKDLKSQLMHWPLPELRYGDDDYAALPERFKVPLEKEEILAGENHRIDVTPHLGTAVKAWKIFNDNSMLNSYTGQLSLIKTFYSIFNDSFYDNPNTRAEVLNNLAKYFGTEAVVVVASKSPMASFEEAEWERFGGEASVVFPPFKTGLVSTGKIPIILVVGNKGKGVYKQVFRSAVEGVASLDRGILVEGRERIGDYSLDELSKFDLVVLQGYKYKNRGRDLVMLRDYISGGGSVFVDTGWQFVSPDWGKDKGGGEFSSDLPEPFPVPYTTWGAVGRDWEDASIASEFTRDVLVGSFAPLTWEESNWSVASAREVRSWAQPILAKNGNVLVAGGQLGEGRIVWSGMNIFAHSQDMKSLDEVNFLRNVFDYLLYGKETEFLNGFTLSRARPEILEVEFNREISGGEQVYFREAYYPYWKAELVSEGKREPLSISVAGPQFMLVTLPSVSAGDSLVFTFSPGLRVVLPFTISILTFALLLLMVIDELILRGRVLRWFKKRGEPFGKLTIVPLLNWVKRLPETFAGEEEEY